MDPYAVTAAPPRDRPDTRPVAILGAAAAILGATVIVMLALTDALSYSGGVATAVVALVIVLIGFATIAFRAGTAVWIVNGIVAVIGYLWGFIMLLMLLPSPQFLRGSTIDVSGSAAATYVAAAVLFFVAATTCALAATQVHRVWRRLEGPHGSSPPRADIATVGGRLLMQRQRDQRR